MICNSHRIVELESRAIRTLGAHKIEKSPMFADTAHNLLEISALPSRSTMRYDRTQKRRPTALIPQHCLKTAICPHTDTSHRVRDIDA